MNPYAILPFICLILLFGLGIFVLLHKPKTTQKILLSLLYFEAFYWQLVWFTSFFSVDPQYTDYLAKLAYVSITFLPFTFYHFIVSYLKLTERRWVLGSYTFGILLVVLLPTDLFVAGHQEFDWGNFAAPGPLYPVYMLSALGIMTRGLFLLIRAYQKLFMLTLSRNQLRYVFLGLFLYYTCAIDFLSVYGARWYPLGEISFLGSFLIITYAILRHRLMDIEVIIKRTLVFAGLASFVFGVFAFVAFVVREFIGQYVVVGRWWSSLISVMTVVALYEPLRTFLVNVTDKYLFQKKSNFAKILKDTSRDIALVTSLNELTRKMIAVLVRKARIKSIAIYVRVEQNDHLELKGYHGYGRDERPFLTVSIQDPIIKCLGEKQSPITRNVIEDELKNADSLKRSQLERIAQSFKSLKADVIVPSFLGGPTEGFRTKHTFMKLQSILVLGAKKSDEDYYEQDLDMLATLAQEHAITFENVRLFDVVLKEREDKLKAQSEARMVAFSKSIAHEIKNSLAGLYGPAQFMTMYAYEDLKKLGERISNGKPPGAAEKKFGEILGKMKEEGEKIFKKADEIWTVALTAQDTLSSSEEHFGDLDFKVVWDAAVVSVKPGKYRLVRDVPERVCFYGNVVLIQRVLVNLINNAIDATHGQQNAEIMLKGCYKEIEGKRVAYFEFSDNGPGIPEGLQDRIFEQGFSTKPRPKSHEKDSSGYGQGLWVCKKVIEEIHKGKIWIESVPGMGTIFKFWLPLSKEKAPANSGLRVEKSQ